MELEHCADKEGLGELQWRWEILESPRAGGALWDERDEEMKEKARQRKRKDL